MTTLSTSLIPRLAADQALGKVVAYHGTRTAALQSILDNGILAHPFMRYHPARFYTGERGASVYVTEDPDVARGWALSEVDDPADVTILEVELPADRIKPDEEADKAERFIGDVPPEWIRAAYPLLPDGTLGTPVKFPEGETPDDPCSRLVAVKHEGLAQDATIAMDRATVGFRPLASQRSRIAMDRASVREKSRDGHLHVAKSHISKATVNPYWGREIPNFEKLGLDADKKYMLLRHPDELAKAAPSFRGKPILLQHTPVTSEAHRPDLTIGSVGSNVEYNHPYLDADLAFWPQPAIDAIEDEDLKELSCAYHYDPDMTPGVWEGQRYDGVMRNIHGNHLALVKDGRAGSDVIVADAKFEEGSQRSDTMPKYTPAAMVTRAALLTYLTPRLAQDQKIDLAPALKDLTSKTYGTRKDAITTAVREAVKGKLAQDADIEDLANLLDALKPEAEMADEAVLAPRVDDDDRRDDDGEGEDSDEEDTVAKIKEYLKTEGVSDDIIANLDAFLAEAGPDDDDDVTGDDNDDEDKDKDKDKVTKQAMDAAIKKVAVDTRNEVMRTQREIREAERFVHPWVGDLAMDSATCGADVFRIALDALGVKGADKMHPDALKPVLEVQPKPSEIGRRPATSRIAQDASGDAGFYERYPEAKGVRVNP